MEMRDEELQEVVGGKSIWSKDVEDIKAWTKIKIKAGDTAGSLAVKYKTTVATLEKKNKAEGLITNIDKIKAGQDFFVPQR